MPTETTVVVGKAVAGGATAMALFGFTWWSVVFAVIGAFAAIHFQNEAETKTVFKTLTQIIALAFVGIMAAVWVPHLWAISANVPIEVRAGTGGLLSNLIWSVANQWLGKKGQG